MCEAVRWPSATAAASVWVMCIAMVYCTCSNWALMRMNPRNDDFKWQNIPESSYLPSLSSAEGFILNCKNVEWKMCFIFHTRIEKNQIISLKKNKKNSLVLSVMVTAPIFSIFSPNVIVTSEYCKLPTVYCIRVFRAYPLTTRFSSSACANCSLSTAH